LKLSEASGALTLGDRRHTRLHPTQVPHELAYNLLIRLKLSPTLNGLSHRLRRGKRCIRHSTTNERLLQRHTALVDERPTAVF
jgi:hypothetical protein